MLESRPLVTIHRGFRRPDPQLIEGFDADGVVVIPADRLEIVLTRLERVLQAETRAVQSVLEGATISEGARKLIAQATIIE
jgi:hypothetical protein